MKIKNKPTKNTLRFKVLGWADVYLDKLSKTEFVVVIFKDNGFFKTFKFNNRIDALKKYDNFQ